MDSHVPVFLQREEFKAGTVCEAVSRSISQFIRQSICNMFIYQLCKGTVDWV